MAQSYGATAVNASSDDPVQAIRDVTNGAGVDVAIEVIGLPLTIQQAVRSLAIGGRAAIAGITDAQVSIGPYRELIAREAELIGVSDHLKTELVELARMVEAGRVNLKNSIARRIALDAPSINETLDRLDDFADDVRVVITP